MFKYLTFFLFLNLSSLLGAEVQLGTIEVTEIAQDLATQNLTSSENLSQNSGGETLGEYLKNQQFVKSATFGPAVGRPVIKGLDGYRVGITNGSIAQNDLSAMSHDHAVAMMAKIVEKMELIKGPSSLLYGNNSAGVIRNMGEEHIDKFLKKGFGAKVEANSGANGVGTLYGGKFRYRKNNSSIYLVHFTNEANEYQDGNSNNIKDSDTYSSQVHLVLASKLNSHHIVKAYFDRLDKEYGIPNTTDERTWIDMGQTRYGVVAHSKDILGGHSMQSEIQYSDYLHTEYEKSSADGLFGQKLFSLSNKAHFQTNTADIETTIQYNNSNYKVCHEHGTCTEFVTAPRTSIEDGISLQKNMERFNIPFVHGHPMPNIDEQIVKLGGVVKQFLNETYALDVSLRGEFRNTQIDNSNIQEDWLITENIDPKYYNNKNDQAMSGSIGLYGYYDDLSIESSLSYMERLPASSELYWNGFHHATNSYIIGDRKLENEKSTNYDISFLYERDLFASKLSAYYYHFDNYLFQTPLNNITDPFHNTEVWQMQGQQAKLYGIGLIQSYHQHIANAHLTHKIGYETMRGILNNGGNIPRMSPDALTLTSEVFYKKYNGKIEYKYVDKSRNIALNETHTPAHYAVNLQGEYKSKNSFGKYTAYIKGLNLTNSQIYNHISFLKNTAPLAGRQILMGVKFNF